MRKLLLAAAGIAATLALTQAPARAALVFTPTTFNGNKADWERAIKQRNQNQNEYRRT